MVGYQSTETGRMRTFLIYLFVLSVALLAGYLVGGFFSAGKKPPHYLHCSNEENVQ